MARKKRIILRITGWILGSLISLILLVTLAFYLGRGWILHRALDYVNENQPGEIRVGRINLIPFLIFPDAVLQLRNVSFYEKKVYPDSLYQEPILYLNEIYVSLNTVKLIKGEYVVSRSRIEDGFIRMEIYEDSVSNIERALGIRFNDESEEDTTAGMPDIHLDMERLQVENVLLAYRDRTLDNRVQLVINHLENRFSYLPERIDTDIQLDVDINQFKYLDINLEKKYNVRFLSQVNYDPVLQSVDVSSSSLHVAGLELDAWGTYRFGDKPGMDLAFRAKNSGLDLLNFLFSGLLDMDEIEQIGEGRIHLSGNINGIPGNELPVIRLNGRADELGFRIKSIQRDVTGISFAFYATNGRKPDLSEAMFHMEGFTATFPEGIINAELTASNAILPEVKLEMDGNIELDGLEHMIETDMISSLQGNLVLRGDVQGVVDLDKRDFLKDAGEITATLHQVGFVMRRDTVFLEDGTMLQVSDTIRDLSGAVYLRENRLGTDQLAMELNGSRLEMGVWVDNLLLYLLDGDTEVQSEIVLASDQLQPGMMLQDPDIAELVGTSLHDLRLQAGITVSGRELDRFLESDSIPGLSLEIINFAVNAPVFNYISDVSGMFRIDPEALEVVDFSGTIGGSSFMLGSRIENYQALLDGDTTGWTAIHFDLSSEQLKAEDFFTYRDSFLLPEEFSGEDLQNLRLSGYASAPAHAVMSDPGGMDFRIEIREMGFDVGFYPHPIRHFHLKARREGERLVIDTLKGSVGESNLMLSADLMNFTDTIMENWRGSLVIASDLLDVNSLMDFTLPGDVPDTVRAISGSTTSAPSPRLDLISYPGISATVHVEKLVYEEYNIFDLKGQLRTNPEKILYLDRLSGSTESGGKISLSGQFNVSSPYLYTFSTEFDIDNINIRDFPEMETGDSIYRLETNFQGLISANGLAEVFMTPDLTFDLDNTTAVFNVIVSDGALIDFSPLQVAGKYLDNRDLNNVRFATLQNSFPLTLSEGTINVPLTVIESTLGQMLIEGEQNLDNTFIYLLKLPWWLLMDAIKGRLTPWKGKEVNDQIYEFESGRFLNLTVLSDGTVKLGDKRDKYLDGE